MIYIPEAISLCILMCLRRSRSVNYAEHRRNEAGVNLLLNATQVSPVRSQRSRQRVQTWDSKIVNVLGAEEE